MKHFQPVCLVACLTLFSSTGFAQQELYACTSDARFVRVLDYASQPATRVLIDRQPNIFFATEMAVRSGTGYLYVSDLTGIDTIREINPATGLEIGLCTVFGVQSWAIDCDATDSLVGAKWDNAPARIYSERSGAGICVDVPGAAIPSLNRTDIAVESGGTLLTLPINSTVIQRVDRATGTLLGSHDIGQRLEGIEVDTDGAIYGLTEDGTFWSVTLSPPQATALGVLNSPGSNNRWTGLAFRHSPLALDVQAVCDGLPNTTGQSARLTIGDPAAAGTTTLGFRVDGLPPGRAALMLYGTSPGSTQVGAGLLCIGSPTVALPRPAIADGGGTARFSVDLSAFPGVGQVMAGDSFVLQCTYRDAQTVNFSSASSMTIL